MMAPRFRHFAPPGSRRRQPRRTPDARGFAYWVEGLEPICAGLISGAVLMGIGNAIVNVLMV